MIATPKSSVVVETNARRKSLAGDGIPESVDVPRNANDRSPARNALAKIGYVGVLQWKGTLAAGPEDEMLHGFRDSATHEFLNLSS